MRGVAWLFGEATEMEWPTEQTNVGTGTMKLGHNFAICADWFSLVRHWFSDRMADMWQLTVSWWELVLRAVIIYAVLLVLLRITGKRQVGQLSPFDLVLLLVLSNAVQNAMTANETSVLGGVITAVTLVALNYFVGWATFRNKKIEALVEGRPEVLIHNGKLFTDVMDREQLTHHELNAALRSAGCACVEEVHFAMLENNGQITVQPKKDLK